MKGMLPSLAKGVVEKRTIGKGRKALMVRKAQKTCPYCTQLYDFKLFKDEESPKLEVEVCPQCKAKLDEGFVAIVAEGSKICFVKSERLKDLAGQSIRVSPENFEKIEAEYKANWAPAPKTDDEQHPPDPA